MTTTVTAPEVLTVEAYQCEPGDVLFGTSGKVVIESVLFDGGTVGRWLLIDRMRRVITSKLTGQTFQIIPWRAVDGRCPGAVAAESVAGAAMKLEPVTRDDVWFDDIDDDVFYAAERGNVESITLARHPDGTWFASVNTEGPGYTAHTYWRVDSDRAVLDGVLADGRKRDAS